MVSTCLGFLSSEILFSVICSCFRQFTQKKWVLSFFVISSGNFIFVLLNFLFTHTFHSFVFVYILIFFLHRLHIFHVVQVWVNAA